MKTTPAVRWISIPISPDLKSELEKLASSRGISVAELCKQAIHEFLAEEDRNMKLQKLRSNAIKYVDIINCVGDAWSATESEML